VITDLLPPEQTQYPELDGELCVHALLADASCAGCVQACPKQAWTLTDEALEIDTGACDGCGLCLPACPREALSLPIRPARRYRGSERLLLAGCHRAIDIDQVGSVPCLNSFGLRELLRQRSAGCNRWLVTIAECEECERDSRDSFLHEVTLFNRALQQRGEEPIMVECIEPADWRAACDSLTLLSEEAMSRRHFLRGMASPVAGRRDAHETDPAQLTARFLGGTGLTPWHCSIDVERCNLCEACLKVCPTGAVRLERNGGDFLVSEPSSCNGCALCMDVCKQDAVTVEHWKEESSPYKIAVTKRQCRSCGIDFLAKSGLDPATCQICSSIDHRRNLYQTLS